MHPSSSLSQIHFKKKIFFKVLYLLFLIHYHALVFLFKLEGFGISLMILFDYEVPNKFLSCNINYTSWFS